MKGKFAYDKNSSLAIEKTLHYLFLQYIFFFENWVGHGMDEIGVIYHSNATFPHLSHIQNSISDLLSSFPE